MRREPIKDIPALKGHFCSNIRLSERLRWREAAGDDPHMMIAHLLSVSVLDKDGKPIKKIDEWDLWAGDNVDDASKLFNQCSNIVGSGNDAKKK